MQFFKKTMENVRKHRAIKLVTTNAGRNYYLSTKPSCNEVLGRKCIGQEI